MRFILPLAKISLCLSLFSSNIYSMTAITEELLRRRQASQLEALSKSQTNNATVIEEVVEERVSGVTDTDRDSLPARRPSFLDSINARPQLKEVVVTKKTTSNPESISLDVISSLRSSLKPSSGKPPVSSMASAESADKPNPYANRLKKTSGSAGLTSSDSMESASQTGGHKSASASSKKEKAIEGRVPEADISYVGTARIVKNKK